LIPIDALLDTRIATVSLLCPETAGRLLRTTYFIRDNDEFQSRTFRKEDYRAAYQARNVQTLQASGPTAFADFLFEEICLETSKREQTAGEYIYDIDLNVWPYRLQEDEKDEYVKILQVLFPNVRKVTVVNYSPQKLDPVCIALQHYNVVVLYDYAEWLKLHYPKALDATKLQHVTFIVPKIRDNTQAVQLDPNNEDEQLYGESIKIWGCFELMLCEHAAWRFEDVKHFSLLMASQTA
jgi:hypothetical protein